MGAGILTAALVIDLGFRWTEPDGVFVVRREFTIDDLQCLHDSYCAGGRGGVSGRGLNHSI